MENNQNEWKIPKIFPRCAQIYIPFSIHFLLIFQHKTMERKIGFSIPWKMNVFIFCSMEQNPNYSSASSSPSISTWMWRYVDKKNRTSNMAKNSPPPVESLKITSILDASNKNQVINRKLIQCRFEVCN